MIHRCALPASRALHLTKDYAESTVMGLPAAIPYPNIDPVLVALGPIQLRWYGLMYLIGLTAAYFVIQHKVTRKGLAIRKDQIYDMVVYAAFGVFLGGRIGYTLFYNFSYYSQNPLKLLAVWEGGMSFHGGLLGTIIALIWFSRRQGIPAYTIADLAACVTPIGLGSRSDRELHQRRTLRSVNRRGLVHGLSSGRPCLPSSLAIVRGHAGRPCLVHGIMVDRSTSDPARHDLLEFHHRIRHQPTDR